MYLKTDMKEKEKKQKSPVGLNQEIFKKLWLSKLLYVDSKNIYKYINKPVT